MSAKPVVPEDTLPEMPIAPGSALAGEPPPKRVTAATIGGKPTIAASIPLAAEWPKDRVDARDQKASSARPTVHIPTPAEIEGQLDVLRRACNSVPRPQGLR
jgi:hypothetical protein